MPFLVKAIEECTYTIVWRSAAACPLKSSSHGDCVVTNPLTGKLVPGAACRDSSTRAAGSPPTVLRPSILNAGYLFNLSSLSRRGGYRVYDSVDQRKIYHLNVCGELEGSWCENGTGEQPSVAFFCFLDIFYIFRFYIFFFF